MLTPRRRRAIAFRRGALDASRADFERSLAISIASHGESHADVVTTLVALTTLALDQGRGADALALGERAVRLLDTVAASPVLAAEARLALAKAVFASDPARARELATRAAADVRDLPKSSIATEVAQWLAQPSGGSESPR